MNALKICQSRYDNRLPPEYWDWEGDMTEAEEKALCERAGDNNECGEDNR